MFSLKDFLFGFTLQQKRDQARAKLCERRGYNHEWIFNPMIGTHCCKWCGVCSCCNGENNGTFPSNSDVDFND